ncbi:MAG: MFS transporter [Alphaproteobacteria bacterium]|nr:MFS transporter [Alphaproteobacteria bacterium]MBL6938002.1 MFS transporter [Alphaproteobacteria bacterium]MBL7099173.1 MFS transporter [Alphaproteobacteria bacterium]
MAFFANRTVNLFSLHFIIFSAAFQGGGAFYSIYLVKSGLSIPLALIALGAVQAVRFCIRPLVLVFASRFGLRQTLITGTMLTAVQYPILAEIAGIGPVLYALIVVTAVSDVFYWSSYHATFARLGDDEHRGSQISVQIAGMALVGIVSPILSGWLLATFGPRFAFNFSGLIVLLSVIPMLWTPNTPILRHIEGGFRAALGDTLLLQSMDGFVAAGMVFIWQITLFLTLGGSYLNYGSALAVAALAGAVAGMVLGRFIDMGHGVRMVWIGAGFYCAVVVLRALASGHPWLAVIASALGPFGTALYVPVMMTPVYTRAKASPCVLRFHIVMEGGWDTGSVIGTFLSAALIAMGLSLGNAMLLSLIGTVTCLVVLRRYFLAHPSQHLATAEA